MNTTTETTVRIVHGDMREALCPVCLGWPWVSLDGRIAKHGKCTGRGLLVAAAWPRNAAKRRALIAAEAK